MAGITSTKGSSLVVGLALVLFFLTQVSLTSASFSEHAEFEVSLSLPPLPSLPELPRLPLPSLPFPTLPQLSLPQLPHLDFPPLPFPTLPQLSLPQLPHVELPQFSLPPLPSHVTIPGFTVPGFSIPPQEPLQKLHLPPFPTRSVTIPPLPAINVPAKTFLPPLPSLRFPGFSLPSQSARTVTTPPFNPSELTIPGFTFHTVSVPPTSFPFPRRAYPLSHTQVIKN